ncbi:MAG: NHLP bacteriocin export ABC transporter permease/ATPase subunit [Rhodopila sp.]|jgi:NHLM bacteriocin system ABC transporter ATP-binding protein
MDYFADQHAMALSGDRPVLLRDLPGLWQVTEGAVDIFAVRLVAGRATGRREFLIRMLPGNGFAGMPIGLGAAPEPDGAIALMAVGGLGSEIQAVTDPVLQSATIDFWISGLDRVCRDARDAWADSFASAGEARLEADGKLIAPVGKVLWATVQVGSLLTAEGVALGVGAHPIAVTSMSPLVAATASQLSIDTTQTILGDGRLGPALHDYHARVFPALDRLIAARNAERIEFGRRSEEATRTREAEGMASLAGVGRGRPEAAIAPGAKPAWRALVAVAAALGQQVILPANLGELGLEGRGIQGLAEACGLRSRIVILGADWWLGNNGPLLASLQDTNEAVALLPEKGGYTLWNPATGQRLRVDGKLGLRVRPQAVMLYRRFSDAPITMAGLLAFSLQRNFRRLVWLIALALLGGVLGLFVPWVTVMLVDKVIPHSAIPDLAVLSVGLVIAALSSASVGVVRSLVMQQMEQQVDLAAQSALFDRMLRLPVAFLKSFTVGDLVDRVLGLQTIRQTLTGATLSSAISGLMSVMNVVMMFTYGGKLALIGLIAAVISLGVSGLLVVVQLRQERVLAASRGRAASIVLQLITGIAKLKAAAAVGRARALWAITYARQRDHFVDAQRTNNLQGIFQGAFTPLSMVALYYFAASAMSPPPGIEAGAAIPVALGVGAFLGFSSAYGQLLGGVSGLVGAMSSTLRALPTYERAKPLLTTPTESAANKLYPGVLSGSIELSGITFRYPNTETPVLRDLSFSIKPGEFVAFVGPSGSGKSTILRLLLGFETPEQGEVLYDGKPLSGLDIVGLRRQLGVVLQNGRVQPVPILDNIASGRPVSLDEAWDAVRKAGMEDDIKAMPMGMHTAMNDGGTSLSGGQRQRLMIARALAGKPRILLMDEATSALDNKTQAIVTESVSRLNLTRITIAHRLSTITSVDRVIVLDQGQVVQDGSFAALMEAPGLFRDLAQRQLS